MKNLLLLSYLTLYFVLNSAQATEATEAVTINGVSDSNPGKVLNNSTLFNGDSQVLTLSPTGTVQGSAFGSGIPLALSLSPTGTGSFVLQTSPALSGTVTIGFGTTSDFNAANSLGVYGTSNSIANQKFNIFTGEVSPPTGTTTLGWICTENRLFSITPDTNGTLIGNSVAVTNRSNGNWGSIYGFVPHLGNQSSSTGTVSLVVGYGFNTMDSSSTQNITELDGILIPSLGQPGIISSYGIKQTGGDPDLFNGPVTFGLSISSGAGNFFVDNTGNITESGGTLLSVTQGGTNTTIVRPGNDQFQSTINSLYSGNSMPGGAAPDGKYHIGCYNGTFLDLETIDDSGNGIYMGSVGTNNLTTRSGTLITLGSGNGLVVSNPGFVDTGGPLGNPAVKWAMYNGAGIGEYYDGTFYETWNTHGSEFIFGSQDTGTAWLSFTNNNLTTSGSITATGSITQGGNAVANINSLHTLTGTLSTGTATVTIPSGVIPWVMDNASSITNLGGLAVTVSGTTATVRSSNALDTSPFTLFYWK